MAPEQPPQVIWQHTQRQRSPPSAQPRTPLPPHLDVELVRVLCLPPPLREHAPEPQLRTARRTMVIQKARYRFRALSTREPAHTHQLDIK